MGKLAYFLTLMLLATAVQVSFGASGYVNLGTSAPPTTIGPFSVTPFNTAPQSAIPDFTTVTSIPGDPRGGTLTSSAGLNKRTVPGSWAT
ncbi:hypothetical protein [Hydrogenobacter thermophilus]|uniref:hypothetical protein n=1 Tax=Hydrogenobacter thermophilus TaxID=940 RepID=UPI0030F9B2AE